MSNGYCLWHQRRELARRPLLQLPLLHTSIAAFTHENSRYIIRKRAVLLFLAFLHSSTRTTCARPKSLLVPRISSFVAYEYVFPAGPILNILSSQMNTAATVVATVTYIKKKSSEVRICTSIHTYWYAVCTYRSHVHRYPDIQIHCPVNSR